MEVAERKGGLLSLRLVRPFCFYAPAAQIISIYVDGVPLVSVQLGFKLNSGNCCCPLQLVDMTWQAGMKDEYWLGKDHPGVYLGETQALNEDYTHSGFDRGHLNPNGHHPGITEFEI